MPEKEYFYFFTWKYISPNDKAKKTTYNVIIETTELNCNVIKIKNRENDTIKIISKSFTSLTIVISLIV